MFETQGGPTPRSPEFTLTWAPEIEDLARRMRVLELKAFGTRDPDRRAAWLIEVRRLAAELEALKRAAMHAEFSI